MLVNDIILLGVGAECVIAETYLTPSLIGKRCTITEIAEDNPEWITVKLISDGHYERAGQVMVLRAKHLNASYNV